LADYGEHYQLLRATGTNVIAISVDPPKRSEALRRELRLPFLILCDTERLVVRGWDIYNAREHGGIAKPAVFLLDANQTVRYLSVDSVASRVPASEIVRIASVVVPAARRKIYIPTPGDIFRAVRASLRR